MTIGVGISQDIGMRETMEDEQAVYERPDRQFFSAELYDGHHGPEAARLASEMLTPHFLNDWFVELEKPADARRSDEEMLRQAYIAVDNYIAYRRIRGGAAAVTFYVMEDRFMAANAGDARAIMGAGPGVEVLTLDHKPDLLEERLRIEALGGMVTSIGVARVMGILSMSRALGDAELKPFVTCEPRVVAGLLGKENDYAVLACDGVWDVLKPQTVIALARHAGDPQKGAEDIKETALREGSTDNISVIVLDMRCHVATLNRPTMQVLRVVDKALAPGKTDTVKR